MRFIIPNDGMMQNRCINPHSADTPENEMLIFGFHSLPRMPIKVGSSSPVPPAKALSRFLDDEHARVAISPFQGHRLRLVPGLSKMRRLRQEFVADCPELFMVHDHTIIQRKSHAIIPVDPLPLIMASSQRSGNWRLIT